MPSLIATLRDSLHRHAHRTAVEGADWLLSYRDLDRESAHLAGVLERAGVRAGQLVPMLMGRSPHFIIGMLAVLRCGAAYAPLDLASPASRQAAMMAVLDSPVALVDPGIADALLGGRAAVVVADVLARPTATGRAAARPADTAATEPAWPDTPPQAPAYAMFTSGSSGAPKCVLVPHSGIARLVVDADYARFDADARWTQLASLAFDAATLEIWAPLLTGACCVIQELPLPSLHDLADYLLDRHLTDGWLTAALFNAMVDDRIDAFGGLRQLLIGGERISVPHARACLARWPKLRLINGYGPTENTTFSLCHTITPADLAAPGTDAVAGRAPQIPIGRPIHGTQVRVVPLADRDADGDDAQTWQGGAGELWVAGDGVAIGYLNDPGLTACKFVERDGLRWYRTGDVVAERSDGVFEFCGRADRQVKIQGHRIELEEVERVLASCPGVGNAVVLVQGGSADSRHLVGCYGASGGAAPPDHAAVRRHLAERLPPPAVPNALHLFERVPLNLNGKVDRVALGRLIDDGPATPPVCGAAAHSSPATGGWHTETERQLAAIWARCLPHARLDRHSHFTRVGGSSLLALRVAADVARSMRRRLDALDVLRQPVLAEQARLIDAAGPVEPADLAESGPAGQHVGQQVGRRALARAAARQASQVQLSRSQKSLLQASRLDPSGAAYLVHIALQLAAPLSPQRLRVALTTLVARHPMLRTAPVLDGDAVSARLLPRLPAGWWRDAGALAAAPAGLEWPQPVLDRINQPADLAVDGPMHVHQWSLPGGEHLCVWTVHHFAMDDASIQHALGELDALLRGQTLPPVYGSPFAFAAIESQWTDDAGLTAQAASLVAALRSESRPADADDSKPTRMPLPPAPRRGGESAVALPAPPAVSGRALADTAARWGCTPFTPLVVAYGLALQQVFGAAWRFVLTPFSRRAEPELIEPIGCLLDLRLIEAGARPGESLPQTVRRVHAELLEGLQPRLRPLDRLADAVAAIDPALRAALTQFSITWRPGRRRDTQLAGLPVRLLDVPQCGARFGITLHAEADAGGSLAVRIEAVEEATAAGRVAALARVFAQQFERLCALTDVDLSPAGQPPQDAADTAGAPADATWPEPPAAAAARATLARHAAAAWQRWLGAAPSGPNADFLTAGGSSLLAMRMAATLRRESGASLDIAAFLARPRFDALCGLLAAAPRRHGHTVTLVGARNCRRLLLLLPGGDGGPLGMFRLAQELHGRLPEDWAVAIVDLPSIMRRAPDGPVSGFFAQQLLQVVRDLGEDRIGSIAGFSLGGLLAIDLLNLLGPQRAAEIPLWMIDTYAPQRMRIGRRALIERALINLLRHPLDTLRMTIERLRQARRAAAADGGGVVRDAGLGNLTPKWHAFMVELSTRRFDARTLSATLIHSRSWARTSGLLRHIGSNGFAPASFGRLRIVAVDEPHFELPRSGAGVVARLITGQP